MTKSAKASISTKKISDPICEQTALLYQRAMRATRGGPLFNAFPYPTKISPEAIALFIAVHTKPGDVVFDGFAGSGTTGLGTLLCANPPKSLKLEAEKLGLKVNWGPRKAVLYELSVLGAFISNVLCNPPDPVEFEAAAEQLLKEVEENFGCFYGAIDPDGGHGKIRYVVWSDVILCSGCKKRSTFWDGCVTRSPANISRNFHCPHCDCSTALDKLTRIMETVECNAADGRQKTRLRRMAWVYGVTNGKTWSRPATKQDASVFRKIDAEEIPASVPRARIPWGDLYRAGYHEGISELKHFYTRRNLIVFGRLWEAVDRFPPHLHNALRFWLLSYNAAHSTLMTRVVAKKGQSDLVVTSAQPGVLYVSGLPVEKNIFSGVRRKLKTILSAFRQTSGFNGLVEVRNASCLSLDLESKSIDYAFTDLPFGGNIPYAEVNYLNEVWLGRITNQNDEVVVSQNQNKSLADYTFLLEKALGEVSRVLKDNRSVTLVFHSSTANVWNALATACNGAGFSVNIASVLDKTQASFKQVTADGAVRGDPVLLLTKQARRPQTNVVDVWKVAEELVQQATFTGESNELSPQRLYSRLVSYYLSRDQSVPIDAAEFYCRIAERLGEHGCTATN